MSYLFYIDSKNNAILHPEVVKLCPSFNALSDKEVLFVILYADYNSIYKQFPDHERKRKAMWHAFDDNEIEIVESDRVKICIQDYISLQYNSKIETARKYQQKIDKLLMQLDEDDSPSSIEKIDKAIDALNKRINSMNKEILEDTIDEGVLKGGRTKSLLEKLISNKKRYESIVGHKL